MRIAIYYAPAADTDLWRAGCAWLGRDAASGESWPPVLAGPLGAARAGEVVSSPARYGFHATLVAPFRPGAGANAGNGAAEDAGDLVEDMAGALRAFAASNEPESIELEVSTLAGFAALTPRTSAGAAAAGRLARRALEFFDGFRAPLDGAEFARRAQGAGRAPDGAAAALGVPACAGAFPLSHDADRRLEAAELEIALACARAHFSPFLAAPVRLDTVAMFVQEEPDDPFRIHTAVTIGGH